MKKKFDYLKALVVCLSLLLVYNDIQQPVYAMHIMEGFLPAGWCIAWGTICIPFLIVGASSIKNKIAKDNSLKVLLAIAGAFVFVLSSLKMPSVTGSSSHATGTGLGAILFGPFAMSILGIIVLLFQALLLAHGGLTTLGANTFSMAIAGPFVAFGIFALMKKTKIPKSVVIFTATFFGDIVTYLVTSTQLALAFSENGFGDALVKFLGVFAVTQLPIAIAEGLLSVVVYNILEKNCQSELKELRVL